MVRRPAIVLFLAAAGALTVAGIALAAANSTSSFSIRCDGRAVPQKCPQNTYTKARLNIHTHTNYTNPGNPNPGGATKRIQIFFDNDSASTRAQLRGAIRASFSTGIWLGRWRTVAGA